MKSNKIDSTLGCNNISIKDRMMNGEYNLILENLKSDNKLGNVLAIIAAVKNRLINEDVSNALKKLKYKDESEFCFNISDLAIAALDVLKIEPYTGNNKQIIELIRSNFDFDR